MVEKIIYKIKRFRKLEEKYPDFPQCSNFIPVFDSTDHFHFVCAKCKEIATILLITRHDSYAHTPTIYFLLQCPICKCFGIRKIYIEDVGKHYLKYPEKLSLLAKTSEENRPRIHIREPE